MHPLTVMWAHGMHTLTASLRCPPHVELPDTIPQPFLRLDLACITVASVERVVWLYPRSNLSPSRGRDVGASH